VHTKSPTETSEDAYGLDLLNDVQVLNLELYDLPKSTTDEELRKKFFRKEHAFALKTEGDAVTGKCNGRGSVSVRSRASSSHLL